MQRGVSDDARDRVRPAHAGSATHAACGRQMQHGKPRARAGWCTTALAACGGLLLLLGSASAPGDAGTTAAPSAPPRVSGERRARAQAWLGDPETLIEEHLPGAETAGVCMVSSDCAAGFECVVAGFEGHCVKQ